MKKIFLIKVYLFIKKKNEILLIWKLKFQSEIGCWNLSLFLLLIFSSKTFTWIKNKYTYIIFCSVFVLVQIRILIQII
jgi:hypothetical protein